LLVFERDQLLEFFFLLEGGQHDPIAAAAATSAARVKYEIFIQQGYSSMKYSVGKDIPARNTK
jgi:hypothetical protein